MTGGGWAKAHTYAIRFAMIAFSISVIVGVVWTLAAPTSTVQAERATVSGFLIAASSALAAAVGYLRDTKVETGLDVAPTMPPGRPSPTTAVEERRVGLPSGHPDDPAEAPQALTSSLDSLTAQSEGSGETFHPDHVAEFRLAVTVKAPDGNPILLEAFDTQSATLLINQFAWLNPNERRGDD